MYSIKLYIELPPASVGGGNFELFTLTGFYPAIFSPTILLSNNNFSSEFFSETGNQHK
jgi:hypothetical protein